MSTYTSVRAMVPAGVAAAARVKAETEGKPLAEKVAELLEAYAAEAPRTRAKPGPKSKRTRAKAT